jgi:hypothetical protein
LEKSSKKTDREEGWALLDRATGRHQAFTPVAGMIHTEYKSIVDDVDQWENTWFDVAAAALTRSFPEVGEVLISRRPPAKRPRPRRRRFISSRLTRPKTFSFSDS